jgi:hypothetical protein
LCHGGIGQWADRDIRRIVRKTLGRHGISALTQESPLWEFA